MPLPKYYFTIDQRLRAAGFRIVSRPAKGNPVWCRGNVRYEQPAAVAICDREAAAKDGLVESKPAEAKK